MAKRRFQMVKNPKNEGEEAEVTQVLVDVGLENVDDARMLSIQCPRCQAVIRVELGHFKAIVRELERKSNKINRDGVV